ncbi:MAG: UvrD-helicase domain-containing protein, partial [Gammaproteobacteria bacterium]|nr:UvrD-helicase domain-containing protein [Gammaproteobacteria bacterium]
MSDSADRSTREYALDPLKSFAIRAPAGSGKTTLLTNRILRLLATVDSPELIVAMTFTKKAAQEMRERVINALNAIKNSESHADPDCSHELAKVVLERDSQLNWHLIENPSRLRIMTIDSFSQRLVRQMPISSGVGEGFSLV